MKKSKVFKSSNIIILLFLVLLIGGGVLFVQQNQQAYAKVIEDRSLESAIALKNSLSDEQMKEKFKDITGFIDNKILRKKEVADFTYYKVGHDNYAVLRTRAFTEEGVRDAAANLGAIYEKATEKQAQILYINTPSRLDDNYKRKLENVDYQEANDERFLASIDKNIPLLDLRKNEEINKLDNAYYKTDHHFTIETAFSAYKATVETFREIYNEDLDPQNTYTDINNYEMMEKEKVFSGSTRQNIGKMYEGKEDFRILIPKYDTLFEFKHFDAAKELTDQKQGTFEESLCDMKRFEDDKVQNKYNVFLGGANTETIIKNEKALNDKKLLVLATSYARIYVPLIAQSFGETRFLDPQPGRFEDSVTAYMDEYNPDVVIVMNESYTSFNVE